MQNNVEVVHTYRQHIVNDMNPSNLHLFINAYNRYWDTASIEFLFVGLEHGIRQRGLTELAEDTASGFEQRDGWDRESGASWSSGVLQGAELPSRPPGGWGGEHKGDTVTPSQGLE